MTLWNLENFRKLIMIFCMLCLGQSRAADQQIKTPQKKVATTKSRPAALKKPQKKSPSRKKITPPPAKKKVTAPQSKTLNKPKQLVKMPDVSSDKQVPATTNTPTHSDLNTALNTAPSEETKESKIPLHKPEPFHDMPRHDDRKLDEDEPKKNDNASESDDNDEEEEEEDKQAPPKGKKIMIRVLLKEIPTDQKVTFTIQSSKGFVLESPIASGKRARWKHEILNLLANDGNLFLLTEPGIYKRIKTSEITLASVDGELKIDNNRYRGTVYLRIDPKTKNVQMVNKVDLDDYIYAVLRYESLSYWPLEMHKVQAIASRSYAVRQIKLTRSNAHSMPFYDIKNYNIHQVYNGDHDSFHLRKAVDATHNLVLTYKDNIALTMFDICCGGIIQSFMKKKDADKPYLFRKTKCTYCTGKANYEWHHSINKERLLQNMLDKPKLTAKAKKIGKITGISIKEKDRAGIVHRVLVHGSKNNISFTNNEFKSALDGRAKSNAYSVKKLNDTISTHGYGFGHNMGLCQIGARELVSKGWDYQEILEFYFPKTKMMRLKVI